MTPAQLVTQVLQPPPTNMPAHMAWLAQQPFGAWGRYGVGALKLAPLMTAGMQEAQRYAEAVEELEARREANRA